MSRPVLFALVLSLVGCRPAPELEHTTKPLPPVQVAWQELHRSATQVLLIARVERRAALTFPLQLSVRLPAGTALVSGRGRLTLPPNAEAAVDEELMTFTYAQTPEDDLELLIDGVAIDVGIHARAAYRFGRSPPQHRVVAPTGPELWVGGKNLGPSVPVKPQ